MKKLFSGMTGMILTALGLDRQAVRALEARRDVVPPASDYQRPQSGRRSYRTTVPGNGWTGANARRRERRATGVTARQQRLRRQAQPTHPQDKIFGRIAEAVYRNQRPGRAQERFINRYMVGYGPGCRKEAPHAQA